MEVLKNNGALRSFDQSMCDDRGFIIVRASLFFVSHEGLRDKIWAISLKTELDRYMQPGILPDPQGSDLETKTPADPGYAVKQADTGLAQSSCCQEDQNATHSGLPSLLPKTKGFLLAFISTKASHKLATRTNRYQNPCPSQALGGPRSGPTVCLMVKPEFEPIAVLSIFYTGLVGISAETRMLNLFSS
ncbi:hypothetical protein VNO77_18855 [Canavalia gladiata]|uniref:Uncharacterized protein n=1 Tax=Canavalia gladiata TaxID=3824 RepID=A0AAN9LLP4_CANGL